MEWEKNDKSIVSGSETIDRGFACWVSHTCTGHFLFQQVSLSSLSGLSPKGNSLSQQISPASFILPVGDGFVPGVCFEESGVPGCVPQTYLAQDKEIVSPDPQTPGETDEAGGNGGEGGCGLVAFRSRTRNSRHWLLPASRRLLAMFPGSGALLVILRGKCGRHLRAPSALNTGSELLPPRPKEIHLQLQEC